MRMLICIVDSEVTGEMNRVDRTIQEVPEIGRGRENCSARKRL